MQVKIYTDGAARGNPDGPGGYGAVLQYIDTKGQLHERELSRGYKKTTNNRMELMAAIVALEALNRPCQVDLYSDSKYLVDAFNQHWIDSWLKKNIECSLGLYGCDSRNVIECLVDKISLLINSSARLNVLIYTLVSAKCSLYNGLCRNI